MSEQLTEKARAALEIAITEAGRAGQAKVASEHILFGLVSVRGSAALVILHELGVRIGVLRARLESLMQRPVANELTLKDIGWTTKARLVRREAVRRAVSSGAPATGTHHLLLGLLSVGNCQASSILREKGVSLSIAERTAKELPSAIESSREEHQPEEQETQGIESFCRDLTELARKGELDPVIGREREIGRIVQVLCRRKKSNPILIGEPGVGKTAIVEGLAGLIVSGTIPDMLSGKRLLALDMAAVVAGTKYRGQFEQRLKKLLTEIAESGDIVLFIDEVHVLVGAGAAEGALDAANLLKPALARGELQCIGATTLDEYRKRIEKDGALERRFQPVPIDPPSVDETIGILEGLRTRYEEHHGTVYTDDAVQACARLAARYISGRFLPDKAIDVMDEAGAKNRVCHSSVPEEIQFLVDELSGIHRRRQDTDSEDLETVMQLRKQEEELERELSDARSTWLEETEVVPVSEDLVAAVVSDMTGIPVSRVGRSETARLLDLEEKLEERIVGQRKALETITGAIRRSRIGLRDSNRPAGTFLFLGPSGVGKTETARILAELVFGEPSALIRIDMSEFQESFTGSRLVGAPPGYVGYDEGGVLTEKVRRRPYSIVLLDEIEKAHSDLYNMLLQVMDYGRMTDSYGREIDFTNTIIIMTSNIASRSLLGGGHLGFSGERTVTEEKKRIDHVVMEAVRDRFNPEFLNRLDEIVVFNPLEFEHMERIVDLQMQDVEKRLEDMRISLTLSPEALTLITEAGYDPDAGARHLRRTIRRLVEDPLTDAILRSKFGQGDHVIAVREESRLVFRKTGAGSTETAVPQELHERVDN